MRITALLAALGVVVSLAGQSHADEINRRKSMLHSAKPRQCRATFTATAFRAATFK